MRCPKCKRFSKEVRVPGEGGKWTVYSDCVVCGRVLVESEEIEAEKAMEGRNNWIKVSLGVLFVLSAGLSGFLYYRTFQNELMIRDLRSRYSGLYDDYMVLLNTSSTLQGYYDELTGMYTVLRGEYSDFEDLHSALLREKAALQGELDELNIILNLGRSMVLEGNRTIMLMPEGNVTLVYDAVYAGFIEVNFTASADVFFWVGSSFDGGRYYARYPAFPGTAVDGSFTVPVVDVININVFNANEEIEAVVYLSIRYVY